MVCQNATNKVKNEKKTRTTPRKCQLLLLLLSCEMAAILTWLRDSIENANPSSPYIIFLAAACRENGAEETATPNCRRSMIWGRCAVV